MKKLIFAASLVIVAAACNRPHGGPQQQPASDTLEGWVLSHHISRGSMILTGICNRRPFMIGVVDDTAEADIQPDTVLMTVSGVCKNYLLSKLLVQVEPATMIENSKFGLTFHIVVPHDSYRKQGHTLYLEPPMSDSLAFHVMVDVEADTSMWAPAIQWS